MFDIDWSQFIPDLIIAIFGVFLAILVGGIVAIFSSGKFKKWFDASTHQASIAISWILSKRVALFFLCAGIIIFGVWRDMKIIQLIILFAYTILCIILGILIWSFMVWPLIRNFGNPQPTTSISTTIPPTPSPTQPAIPLFPSLTPIPIRELAFSNMQITVKANGDVTLRTVINSISEGNRKPVNILLPSNFSIIEGHENLTKSPKILEAKPNSTLADIIVLIDTSGSMNNQTGIVDNNGYNLTKLEVVKESVLLFVNDFIESEIATIDGKPSRIAFLPFSTNGVNFLTRDNGDIWFPTLQESRGEIQRSVNSLEPAGDTPMYDALAYALDVIQDSGEDNYKILFCLTDGLDNVSKLSAEIFQKTLEDSNTNIPIITVGYGIDGEYNRAILEQISSSSGAGQPGLGSFMNILPQEVSDIFRGLSTDLNNIYEIRWKSSFPKPGNVILATITVNYVTSSGETVVAEEKRLYTIPVSGR